MKTNFNKNAMMNVFVDSVCWLWLSNSPSSQLHIINVRENGLFNLHVTNTFEPPHDKTNKMACAPSEDSDQPGHPPSHEAAHLSSNFKRMSTLSAAVPSPAISTAYGTHATYVVTSITIQTSTTSVTAFRPETSGDTPCKKQVSHRMTKPTKWHLCPAKTQISQGIRPVWSESSLYAWRNHGSLATHWAQAKTLIRLGGCPDWSESSLGAQVILLVLSWGGSN